MNAKPLEKQYAKLTAHERAVLVLNAFGRNDKSEATRLIDTSPRIELSAPACGRMFHRLCFAINWHCLKQAENAATLFLLSFIADAEPDLDKYPDPEGAVMVTAYNIITRADGWKIFCGELGLDPVGALRIASADELLLDMAERIARAVEPDVNEIRENLRATLKDAGAEPKTAEQVAAEYRAFLNVSR